MEQNLCPLCDKHPVLERSHTATILIHNESVEYTECFCTCTTRDEDYCTPMQLDNNLLNAQNAYLMLHGKQPMTDLKAAYAATNKLAQQR